MGEWNLGERLRRFRNRKSFSIYDVQDRTNYHYTTISKYERNERQPSLEALRELAACYDVTIADLLANEEELIEDLPTHMRKQASLLVERRDLAEILELLKQLSPNQIGHLIEFLAPMVGDLQQKLLSTEAAEVESGADASDPDRGAPDTSGLDKPYRSK